jgi:SRSO17 transposase
MTACPVELPGEIADSKAMLEELAKRMVDCFPQTQLWQRAVAYLQGLLGSARRKNSWQLAEALGESSPDPMQYFLRAARWDADRVRDVVREYVVDTLGDPQGILVLDETGFVKKGTHSVGVHRQYSGTAGRIENCQIGVFLGYTSRHGHALIDRILYLPHIWADDPERCWRAGVPPEVRFTTKPKMGHEMLERAFAAGVPCAWVVADTVYGEDHLIRRCAEQHGRGYVLAVTCKHVLGQRRVDEWLADLTDLDWHRLSAGTGAKGPRLYDWAVLPYTGAAPGWSCRLLFRRSLENPTEISFYLTHAPQGTRLETLVQVAGSRWTIEQCFEDAKQEVGLDDYEVRTWPSWHRHITLAMMAFAYLAALHRAAIGGRAGPHDRGSGV